MTVGDDKELFEHAMSDAPAEAPADPAPVKPEDPQPDPKPRDEQGRFAKKEADEPSEPATEQGKPPAAVEPDDRPQRSENRIPLAEHLSVRERAQRAEQERDQERQRREDLERRLQALERQRVEPPKEEAPPDVWADPEAFIDHRLKTVQQQTSGEHERVSRLLAVEKFGADAVQSALDELGRQMASNPGARFEHQRIMAADHPYGELIAWHKRQSVLREIGEDPDAYKAQVRDQLKNDPEFVKTVIETARQSAQPAKGAPQAIDLPPSLNRTTGAGGQVAPSAPRTEAEIFQELYPR